MNNNQKVKIILLTVSVVLTAEIFAVALLRGFGVMHVGFGKEMTTTRQHNATQELVSFSDETPEAEFVDPDSEEEGESDIPDESDDAGDDIMSTTTTMQNEAKVKSRKTSSSTRMTTTTKATTTTSSSTNHVGDNDANWLDGWF